ncbi:MAG: T9SS type A sorting domain-containing protein [Bacteroidales bacterium]|nr:T9SS type A sorting domain-containing protein [Bacteroidales bacterium]
MEEAGQEVLVYSTNGQIVMRQTAAASGPTRIDMGHLPTGTYLVRSGNAVAKVVKQ